jgi:hypothetical protein
MRDLTGEVPNAIAAERSRVATEGWGAQHSRAIHWNGARCGQCKLLEHTARSPSSALGDFQHVRIVVDIGNIFPVYLSFKRQPGIISVSSYTESTVLPTGNHQSDQRSTCPRPLSVRLMPRNPAEPSISLGIRSDTTTTQTGLGSMQAPIEA